MKSLPKITPCILVFLLVFLIAACGGPADEHGPTDEPGTVAEAGTETGPVDEDNAHALGPCGVTEAMVGQELAVAGNVELIDGGDPNGLFVGLTERGCMLGHSLMRPYLTNGAKTGKRQSAKGTRSP